MRKHKEIWLLVGTVFTIWLILTLIDNKRIEITHYDINSNKIKNECTIVQISDLHNTSYGKNNKILFDKIKEAKPDIITITGDLIDSSKTNINIAMNFVNQVVEIAPTYYVPGNHEAWAMSKYTTLKTKLNKAGVIVLETASKEITINYNKINILGITDPDFTGEFGISDVDIVSTDLDTLNYYTDNFTILLSHRPELFEAYKNRDIDLVLAGHAHGGQFRTAIGGGLVAPNQGLFPKYISGLHASKKDEMQMIISRGLGNSVIPLRINNRPELVVIRIL